MKQRVSLITLGVRDLARARAFNDGLGWKSVAAPADDVVYFHSGTLPDQLRSRLRQRVARWGFRRVDEVWTTNASLVNVIGEAAGLSGTNVWP